MATMWTVGFGGDYATIAVALASGQVVAGDTIDLVAGYFDETPTVTINNLTFNGCLLYTSDAADE